MVLMIRRVGVGERQRGRPQPRVVLKGSLWGNKRKEKKENITGHIRDNLRISAKTLKFCSEVLLRVFGHVRIWSKDDGIHCLPASWEPAARQ